MACVPSVSTYGTAAAADKTIMPAIPIAATRIICFMLCSFWT